MSYLITTACTGCTACAKICPVTAIRGERKSLYVVDPLICIDCGACGKICPSHAVLDENGELCQSVKRALWKKPLIQKARCVSCGLCLQACPAGVLDYVELVDHQVREIARLKDPAGCIACSFCEMICPVDAISMTARLKLKAARLLYSMAISRYRRLCIHTSSGRARFLSINL